VGSIGGTHVARAGAGATAHHGSFVGNHVVAGNHFVPNHHPGWNGHHRHGFPFFGYGFGGGGWWYPWFNVGSANYGYGYFDPALHGVDPALVPPQEGVPAGDTLTQNALRFAEAGEAAFWSGDYQGAVYDWRHAVLDAPDNPVLVMMLGQGLFATGQYDEAAGATQAAMRMLPKNQWGVVVTNFRELYGNVPDYTTQLRALEKAVAEKPDNPARRFLAGFHYAYLGYPQFAIDQLDKGLKVEPNDQMAKQLRDEMQAKLPPATSTPPASTAPGTGPTS
jgi:tetratricopeptide (TPR) repeat protein